MATRLDRLFLLLDSGSTPFVRKSAAEQLGEVQKLHPHELNNLLSRIHHLLGSTSWDTRIAASQAVDAVARNVPQWEPSGLVKKEESSGAGSCFGGRLTYQDFDISTVLKRGASLLGSEGGEYDVIPDLGLDQKEALARQKKLLAQRMGLDVAGGMGVQTDELFKEEDLKQSNSRPSTPQPQIHVSEILSRSGPGNMSAREKHMMKRKAKLIARRASKDQEPKTEQSNGNGVDGEPPAKFRKTASCIVDQPGGIDKIMVDNVPDNTLNMDEMDEWPFEVFCDMLMNDLFNASWEKRHGASTSLREILKSHGKGAGKMANVTLQQMDSEHEQWLMDLCLRLVCVLALDRFGDYVSDEVVAPVRETCAQTLGLTVSQMAENGVKGVVSVLLQLLSQHQWEVRHGGLLGLKYLLAVRKDLRASLLADILPAIFKGLQDQADDVRAVAASALLPVIESLVGLEGEVCTKTLAIFKPVAPLMVQCLWITLLDIDDLSASTNSIMALLSTIMSHPEMSTGSLESQPLSDLIPRLWPFLKHNITSVRRAALETLYTVLNLDHTKKSAASWLYPILQDALRHIYQRSLVEHSADVRELVYRVWSALVECVPLDLLTAAGAPWIGPWLCLMMQPSKYPFDASLLLQAKHQQREKDPSPSKARPTVDMSQKVEQYIGGFDSLNDSQSIRDSCVLAARRTAAKLLGLLCSYISRQGTMPPPGSTEPPIESLANILLFHLNSKSALQRFATALTVFEWAAYQQPCLCPPSVISKMQSCLSESILYDEIAMSFTRMQTECRDFISGLSQRGVDVTPLAAPGAILSLDQANLLCTSFFDSVQDQLRPAKPYLAMFEERRKQLNITVAQTTYEQQVLNIRVQSSLAGALIQLHALPEKLNPIIRPCMDALKKEENEMLQVSVAASISRLLLEECQSRNPCPNPKVIKNLCVMLCADTSFTPVVGQELAQYSTDSSAVETACDTYSGILTLTAQQKLPERHSRRVAKLSRKSVGVSVEVPMDVLSGEVDEAKKQLMMQRRGATLALTSISSDTAKQLPESMPSLWQTMTCAWESMEASLSREAGVEKAQELVNALQVVEVIGPALHQDLFAQVLANLPALCQGLCSEFTVVRHMCARCVGMLCKLSTPQGMNHVLEEVVPLLGASDCEVKRQGAMEAVAHIIEQLGIGVVPYIVLLIVPVLGRMSDQNEAVRQMASLAFGTLIKLMPLEAGTEIPPMLKESLVEQMHTERKFLEQLLDGSKIESYKVPIPIKAELRKYQQDGVNWLSFLNRYKLHGILCDDMGLGKTLQSICILAGDNHIRAQRYKENGSADSAPLPSLVVCPPTLTGHWVYEVEKFVTQEELNPLHYTGTPGERQRLQKRAKKHNLIVASYDVVRNDIDFFGSLSWNYCILDEGHIIKNSKTKLSKAVKQLSCNHRLILSGTPIQNNVLELWSLFDFLMPGFLGTEKQFQTRYGKPILQSRDAKSSSKEQEAGALAMEALHRQVLPFLLRRMKEDVLQDLPPKIIQDYYCDLSPLQVQLYEDFAKSRAKKSLDDTVSPTKDKSAAAGGATHIFQALQYLRKVCNHPLLVMTPKHPEYDRITQQLKQQKTTIRDLQHAPKLLALKQLLVDCGIGTSDSEAATPVVNQHRVLLFCQLKSMLDIVEKDLLKAQLPNVTYLRLDGTVPAGSRHGLVNRFNNDPSIDILLLTTHVGGLGLNLTGADTVIFVEHDWNPTKDLQAMDRAHRIGQKKRVNVYRLITRGTLEEKIMGLQKFKMNIANSVISSENSSLASMGTNQLLDLFALDDTQKAEPSAGKADESAGGIGVKGMMDSLGDLWDEGQYEQEYNLDNFMNTLSKK